MLRNSSFYDITQAAQGGWVIFDKRTMQPIMDAFGENIRFSLYSDAMQYYEDYLSENDFPNSQN